LDRTRALLLAAVVACATLPYVNILYNGFVYDDDSQVVQNFYIRSFRYLKQIFTTHVWSFTGVVVSNYYRPMMTLGYLFCYKLFGPSAYGFHFASLLLHVLVVSLVFVITERLTGDRVCALVAGVLFALHPVHSEAVAWIAAVTDLEITFFYLLTFGLYVALARLRGGRSERMLVAMLAAFVLALLSKEQALTLPTLATTYEHFYREDRSETTTSQKLARYLPLWLLALAYLVLRIHFFGAFAPVKISLQLTAGQILLSAIALIGQYVGKLLWPVRLCVFYVFHPSMSLLDHRFLAGLLVLLALAALFWVCWRSPQRNVHFASFGVVWFLATLAPVLNPQWMGTNAFTERYLYLPSVGMAWLVGVGASKLWSGAVARPRRRRALALAGIALSVLCCLRIVFRDRDWKNDIVLFNRTLEFSPDAYVIANNLGIAYWTAGDIDKAEGVWRELIAKKPDDPMALNNLGLLANRRHRYEEAKGFLQRAIQADPKTAELHLNLAETYQYMGRPDLAEPQIRAAVALFPVSIRGRNMLGQLLYAKGRVSEAEEQFRASLLNGPSSLAYDYLGMIDYHQGAVREAEGDFRGALGLDPTDTYAHFGLGDIYQATGRKAQALRQYQAGLAKDPTNAQALAAVQELRRQSARLGP
jgi:tetratricopeptide (TPR) repeat protein